MNLTVKELERILKWSYTWDIEVGLSKQDTELIEKLNKALKDLNNKK